MKTSHKFLQIYVPDLTDKGKEFAERITMTGTKTESFEELDKNLVNIVVAKILKIDKHPDADKLVVCQVDVGKEQLQIVTGAPNVYEGMLCPAVLVGGKVAASAHDNNTYENGITIKKGKLRGVESFGMLCSIDELGRPADLYRGQHEESVDGIFDLKGYDCKVGDDVVKLMSLDDCIYDFEITSNRIDCYGVKGIAKEVAATFDLKYNEPNTSFKTSFSEPNYIDLKVEDNDLCPLFATRLIKNVKITESPAWLKDCLRAVGIRPINNIVDITNFVMVEYGQPMHAYDYNTIAGKKIIVKRAKDNEKFISLDGIEHTLDNTMLTINDANRSIGLAGIMGGENTMITEDATTVLFEAANFNGTNVRLSSKKLGMRTDASNTFEKGLDPNNALKAIDRACSLVEELGCGEISKEQVLFIDKTQVKGDRVIEVDSKKINSLLGTNFSCQDMKKTLDKIDLNTEIKGDTLVITVPSIRTDIENFADISEEIIRFYGYDKIGMTLPKTSVLPRLQTNAELVEQEAYSILLYNGFSEAMNYSFDSEKIYQSLNLDINVVDPIKIQNPLGEDFQYMRTTLVNGILNSLAINYKRQNKNVKLFELSNIYLKNESDKSLKDLPNERKMLCFAGYADGDDFYSYKSLVVEFLHKVGLTKNILFKKNENISYLHPYRTADVYYENNHIGYVGEVLSQVLSNYGIEKKVLIASLDIQKISEYADFVCKYTEISKFPSVERDLSVVIDKKVESQVIYDIIEKNAGKLLNEIQLFDVYEGSQLQDGKKSIAYRLTFTSKTETLTVDKVDEIINKIITALKNSGAELRS